MGYDLSKVMFIATSNNMGAIQPALRSYGNYKNVRLHKKKRLQSNICFPPLKEHGLTAKDLTIEKNN
jgi:ATP-dependent Lon protease